MKRECPKCHTLNNEDANFCSCCGNNLSTSENVRKIKTKYFENTSFENVKKWLNKKEILKLQKLKPIYSVKARVVYSYQNTIGSSIRWKSLTIAITRIMFNMIWSGDLDMMLYLTFTMEWYPQKTQHINKLRTKKSFMNIQEKHHVLITMAIKTIVAY